MNRVRALLAVLVLCAAPLSAGACAPQHPTRGVTVLGPWGDEEADAFKSVTDAFTEESGIHVDYQGTAAQREVLLSEVQAGTPPDIAVLSSPGELADYQHDRVLQPLDTPAIEGRYGRPWLSRPKDTGSVYWVPVRADLKSIVWYRGAKSDALGRKGVGDWCVGMGADATSGWPGSDWIEDILLEQSGPEVYKKWATGGLAWTSEPVRRAWATWGAFMAGGPHAASDALHNDYRGPAGQGLLFGEGGCHLEHQGSFARSFYGAHAPRADFVFSAQVLPGPVRHPDFREVSGDFAAMFRSTPESKELIEYLASAKAQKLWAESSSAPAFSADRQMSPDVYRDDVSKRIAMALRHPEKLCLDASDAMPPQMRNVFHSKILEFLGRADDPDELGRVLEELERVRSSVPKDTPWLDASSVCGS